MLLVSPERLNNPGFRDEVLPRLAATCGLLVVDEAHCISDWGHDFRPDYRRIRTLLADLPDGIPVLATTATANARVTDDVAEQLGTRRAGAARLARPRVAAPRRGPAQDRRAAAGLARRPPRRAAGRRHRLLPDRGGHPGGRRLPPLPRPRRRGLLRPDRGHRAHRPRGGPRRRPGQGAGRHQRARHGLRRHASASWSTWARRSRRSPTTSRSAAPAVAPTRPPWSCCPRPRTATSGPTSPRWRSRARSWCARRSRRWPTEGTDGHGRARDPGRAQPQPARDDAQGARRRRRRPPGARRLGGHRRSRGPTTPSATERVARGPRARAARDARLPRHRRLPDALPARAARRPRGGRLRPLRQLRRAEPRRDRLDRRRVEEAGARLARPGVPIEPRKMWPTALATLGIDLKGKIARARRARAAPSPG